ncbi:MAG: DHA2 family efflux MFS transporter permease subunit [Gemmatimonadaceae bacterium]
MASDARRGPSASTKSWVLAATILGSSMAFIDGSVVNVALPAIQSSFAASVSGAQWVVNGYMLVLGALILIGGSAGDLFGRRRVFVIGTVVFVVASVACGLAPTLSVLIGARAIQGLGGALLVPGSLAIINDVFDSSERGHAIGTWAGFSALSVALGPAIGGALVDTVSWRAVFFINVPLAAITLAIALRHVPKSRDQESTSIDWLGGALAVIGLGAITYGLTAAVERSWSDPLVLGATVGGALVIALFVMFEGRTSSPMMPLTLFQSRAFSATNAMTVFLYAGLSGAFFFLPFTLIDLHGYSALEAGAAFLPSTLLMGGLSGWSGGLADRYGPRLPLIVGPIIASVGFALLALPGTGGSYWSTFFPAMLVLGFGIAISVAPLTTTVMGAVERRHSGTASGINNAASRVAGLLAVALLGSVAVGAFGRAVNSRVAAASVSADVRRALAAEIPKLAAARVPQAVTGDARQSLQLILDESFLHSFRIVLLISAGLALCSGLCAAVMLKNAGRGS